MSYVIMKVLESAPQRYDAGMDLLTLGRLGRVNCDIAARLNRGDVVLDVGCGTGALAVLMARKGAHVTAVDVSAPMLSLAEERARQEGVESRVTFREVGAVDLDTAFPNASFDAVVSVLLLSELSQDEVAYTLAQFRRLLRPGGRLLVADEVLPDSWLGRAATFLCRLPFAVLAFVLTQNTTHQVSRLEERIVQSGFRILAMRPYLASTLRLYVAQARGEDA